MNSETNNLGLGNSLKIYWLLLIIGISGHAYAAKPLPAVGSGVPVNVLMCKTAAVMESVVESAFKQSDDEYQRYVQRMKNEKQCEVGGGAKITGVNPKPFYVSDTQQIHIIKLQFGGGSYYTNFNR